MPDLESTSEESKGTSLEERVENNEKKISSIKRILQTKKINSKKLIPSSDQSEKVSSFFISTLAPALQAIQNNLERVLKVNHDQLVLDAEESRSDRLESQQERRRKREDKSEGIGKKAKGLAQRVFKPVISFFDRMVNFFKNILLGSLVLKLLEFLEDPGKIFRPIINWINGIIEGINNITKWIVTTIGKGLNTVIRAINESLNWVERRIGDTIRLFDKEFKDPEITDIPTLDIEKFLDNYLTIPYVPGGSPREETNDRSRNRGTDVVDAKLTKGEFVMSKGAVDTFGPEFMAGINAAGGGNNKPTIKDGVVYADTGGWINPLGTRGSYKGAAAHAMGNLGTRGNGINLTENWPWGANPELPVYAMRDGKVIEGGFDYASYTKQGVDANMSINHGEGIVATYMNMLPTLKPGDDVVRGQQIGRLVDMSKHGANSSDSRLHLEMYKDKVVMNPLPLLPTNARRDLSVSPIPDPPPRIDSNSLRNTQPTVGSSVSQSLSSRVASSGLPSIIAAGAGGGGTPGALSSALKRQVPNFQSFDPSNLCLGMAKKFFNLLGVRF